MLVLPDNDVTGIVEILRRVLESDEWREYSTAVGLRFTSFEEQGLPRNAPDRQVWETCQSTGTILVTANRAGGNDSLDEVIELLGHSGSLPVVTLANPQRVRHDGEYAYRAAVQMLDYLDRIGTLLGVGRLFIP